MGLAFAMRTVGTPVKALWPFVLQHRLPLMAHADNLAMIGVVRMGKNPMMRYLQRTHRQSMAWMQWFFVQNPDHELVDEESSRLCVDIYIYFSDLAKWQSACDLINVVDPKRVAQRFVFESVDVAAPSPFLGGGGGGRHLCAAGLSSYDLSL